MASASPGSGPLAGLGAALGLLAVSPALGQSGFDPTDPIPATIGIGAVRARLETVAAGLDGPLGAVAAPDEPSGLYLVERGGLVRRLDLANGSLRDFLDLRGQVLTGGERGLLGLAFHPDYADNGRLYTYGSEPAQRLADFSTLPPGTAADHQSVVTEWRVRAPGDADARPGEPRVLLVVDQPQANHNGGALAFDAVGALFIAFGDGGAANDSGVGHVPDGNAQDPGNPLGSILRLDPLGDDAPNGRYGIPADNPFPGGPALAETWAWGFRNPYRISFDRATGELWAGDVGQNAIEEVDRVQRGGNHGWNLKEGSFFFDRGVLSPVDPGVPAGLVDPVAEYDHDEGRAVIGGFVYRGAAIPALAGRYVFGDLSGDGPGRLFWLDDGDVIRGLDTGGGSDALPGRLLGMGEDAAGELYALVDDGSVLRIAPPDPAPGPGPAPDDDGGGGGSAPALLFFGLVAWLLRQRRG